MEIKALIDTTEDPTKSKDYKVKNAIWFCDKCEIYCNSDSQFDVHMISQKHKLVLDEETRKLEEAINIPETLTPVLDENNNDLSNVRARPNFSITEISENPVALKFNINAVKYLIPIEKKLGKFEKFGFYCQTCDAYMTGQIQLVMHVRGAKHQFYFPNEIPNYKATKLYNPSHKKRHTVIDTTNFQPNYLPTNIQPKHRQLLKPTNDQFNFYPQQNSQQRFPIQFQDQQINLAYAYQIQAQQQQQRQMNQWNYHHHHQNQQMQFMSTPFNGNNNNNNSLVNKLPCNQPNYGQQQYQSPIHYMLPQNSTPPSSFNRTPLPQKLAQDEENGGGGGFNSNSFTSFGTPGGYPYYPTNAQQQQQQHA